MLKNLDTPLLDLDGEPLKDLAKGVVRDSLVRHFVVNALALMNDHQEVSGEEKMSRYKLAMRLNSGGEQECSPEELSLIKRVVSSMFAPLIVGQVYEWADQ